MLVLLCTPTGVRTKKVNSKRPVNLDITTIKLPLPAYTSILHRLSGVLLFLGAGLLIYALDRSLASEQSFVELQQLFSTGFAKFVIWVLLSGLIYHFVAGVKHLLMDIGIGEELQSGRIGAVASLIISAVLVVLAGVWVW